MSNKHADIATPTMSQYAAALTSQAIPPVEPTGVEWTIAYKAAMQAGLPEVADFLQRIRYRAASQVAQQVASTEDAKDAARYRYLRAATKQIRDDGGGQRTEVTPEEFDAAIDRRIECNAAISATPKGPK